MAGDYRCRACHHHFSVASGTIKTRAHLTCTQWVMAIGLVKLGVSARGLEWALGCHYRTANRALHVLRAAVTSDPLLASLSGEIETDETYYGGRRKGKRGRGAAGKTIVLGFKERGGRVRTVVIPDITRATLHGSVQRHVAPGSTVYTDGLTSYRGMDERTYVHVPFDHSVRFVHSDVVHTQGIEGHWGITKPGNKARYRKLTPKNLPGICAESDFRVNHRENPDFMGLLLHYVLHSYPLSA